MLTLVERRRFRAAAHHLEPVVLIGNAGLTPAVLKEIGRALASHELIKIRAQGEERSKRETLLAEICDALDAQPVQHIGKILVVYRENPDKKAESSPRAAKTKAKAKRRTQPARRKPQAGPVRKTARRPR